jgi:hypothetical protein
VETRRKLHRVSLGRPIARFHLLLPFKSLPTLRSNCSIPDGSIIVEVVLVLVVPILVVLVLADGNNDNVSITKVVDTLVFLPLGFRSVFVLVETVDFATRLARWGFFFAIPRRFLSATISAPGAVKDSGLWSMVSHDTLGPLPRASKRQPKQQGTLAVILR